MRCTTAAVYPLVLLSQVTRPRVIRLVKLVYCNFGFTKHIRNYTNFFIFTTFSPKNLPIKKTLLTFASQFKPKYISL